MEREIKAVADLCIKVLGEGKVDCSCGSYEGDNYVYDDPYP